MIYTRICPGCKKEIEHKNSRACTRGISGKILCRSCTMVSNIRGMGNKGGVKDSRTNRHPKKDLTGLIFSNWIVLGVSHRINGGLWFWDVQCTNCGYKAKRFTSYVKTSKGCMCCQLKPKGEVGMNKLMCSYRDSAESRGLVFILSNEQFRKLTSSCCYYCGSLPHFIKRRKHNSFWTDYVFNGIDRVDNSKGYIVENCVSCCRTCNRGKGAWSYFFWTNHIKRLIVNASCGNIPCLLPDAILAKDLTEADAKKY